MLEFGRELFLLSVQLRQELGKSETNKKMLQVKSIIIIHFTLNFVYYDKMHI